MLVQSSPLLDFAFMEAAKKVSSIRNTASTVYQARPHSRAAMTRSNQSRDT